MRPLAVPVLFVCVILDAMFWHVPAASAQTEYVDVPAVAFPMGATSTYLDSFGVVQGEGAGGPIQVSGVRIRTAATC